nr:MAG TPA: hypothetical protein [Bacteriophage sp.]
MLYFTEVWLRAIFVTAKVQYFFVFTSDFADFSSLT